MGWCQTHKITITIQSTINNHKISGLRALEHVAKVFEVFANHDGTEVGVLFWRDFASNRGEMGGLWAEVPQNALAGQSLVAMVKVVGRVIEKTERLREQGNI